jgi:sn-glycerol 3-phosphate transport system permease protein
MPWRPVVAGVLWLMMFASPYGVVAYGLREVGFPNGTTC